MFITNENNDVSVYDSNGRLRYQAVDVVQFRKFSSSHFVVITKTSIDFVSQIVTENGQDILVVCDTNFESAVIEEQLILIKRKYVMPILDIYDTKFINVLRLYQNLKGDWVHLVVKFKVPVKTIIPKYLNGKLLFGSHKGKPCVFNLDKNSMKQLPSPKGTGIDLGYCISKFNTGGN